MQTCSRWPWTTKPVVQQAAPETGGPCRGSKAGRGRLGSPSRTRLAGMAKLVFPGPHLDSQLAALGGGCLIPVVEGGPVDDARMEGDVDPLVMAPLPSQGDSSPSAGPPEVASMISDVVGGVADVLVACRVAEAEEGDDDAGGARPPTTTGASSRSAGPLLAPGAAELAGEPAAVGDGDASGGEPTDPLEGWRKNDRGYIFSETGRYMGRITSWGKSMSCKCQLHGSKCAIARPKAKYSERDYMLWLKAGLEVEVSEGRSDCLAGQLHLAKLH